MASKTMQSGLWMLYVDDWSQRDMLPFAATEADAIDRWQAATVAPFDRSRLRALPMDGKRPTVEPTAPITICLRRTGSRARGYEWHAEVAYVDRDQRGLKERIWASSPVKANAVASVIRDLEELDVRGPVSFRKGWVDWMSVPEHEAQAFPRRRRAQR
jgi:hypothetical protein